MSWQKPGLENKLKSATEKVWVWDLQLLLWNLFVWLPLNKSFFVTQKKVKIEKKTLKKKKAKYMFIKTTRKPRFWHAETSRQSVFMHFFYKANFGHSKTLKNLSFATLGMLEINENDPK